VSGPDGRQLRPLAATRRNPFLLHEGRLPFLPLRITQRLRRRFSRLPLPRLPAPVAPLPSLAKCHRRVDTNRVPPAGVHSRVDVDVLRPTRIPSIHFDGLLESRQLEETVLVRGCRHPEASVVTRVPNHELFSTDTIVRWITRLHKVHSTRTSSLSSLPRTLH
jgi:hypothetical protein